MAHYWKIEELQKALAGQYGCDIITNATEGDDTDPRPNWCKIQNVTGGAGTVTAKTVTGDDLATTEVPDGVSIEGNFNEITVGVGDTVWAYRTPWTTQQ